MKRETHVIPMVKKKRPTQLERTNGKYLNSLETTQFALEQAVKHIVALQKQADGLARLDKKKEIAINGLAIRVKRLEDRASRSDEE